MSTYFEHNLENIKSKPFTGPLASESLRMAMEALVEADLLAKQVKEKDEEIDELEMRLVICYHSSFHPLSSGCRFAFASSYYEN